MMEYSPALPFKCGSPETAGSALVDKVRSARTAVQDVRRRKIELIASRWEETAP